MRPKDRRIRKDRIYQCWGRLWPPAIDVVDAAGGAEWLPSAEGGGSLLPFGNGRSYGDSCLNPGGTLLDARPLGRILSFDRQSGLVRCEAGVLLAEILDVCVAEGWFLPVTPGTKHVTVAGAIANDVHGKNHHRAGTFGRHVTRLRLVRSDRPPLECTPSDHADLFCATVGGLGLTGLIQWADVQLKRVPGRRLDVETIRFRALRDFFQLCNESDASHEYTVAWIDCLARGRALGRGWFFRGNHRRESGPVRPPRRMPLSLFWDPPFTLVNGLTLRAFNALYYHRPVPSPGPVDYDPFFYPLDAVRNWNRLYGLRGFYQFQCVLPPVDGEQGIAELLGRIAADGQGSFLAVLKIFGALESPGLLSFPRPGPTLAVDFPNRGERTRRLLADLERMTLACGGAIYPAKDACMSPEAFSHSFPTWRAFEAQRDPMMSSGFWRRVTGEAPAVGKNPRVTDEGA